MTYRILSAQLSHETNTFSNTATDMAAFKRRIFVENEGVTKQYANTSTELGAHIAYARENNWTLIQPFAAHGTPSGPVTAHMLNYCIDRLVEQAAHVDGVILALHGAMVAENADDAEG
jgi:microcystin degradation protein MlrC